MPENKIKLFQYCQALGLGREVGGQNGEEGTISNLGGPALSNAKCLRITLLSNLYTNFKWGTFLSGQFHPICFSHRVKHIKFL